MQVTADGGRVAAVQALPQGVAEDHLALVAELPVRVREGAPETSLSSRTTGSSAAR